MPNSKNEIESVRDHMARAYHALAGLLTSLNMAAEVWEQLTPQQQRQYTRLFLASGREVDAEVRTGNRILTK